MAKIRQILGEFYFKRIHSLIANEEPPEIQMDIGLFDLFRKEMEREDVEGTYMHADFSSSWCMAPTSSSECREASTVPTPKPNTGKGLRGLRNRLQTADSGELNTKADVLQSSPPIRNDNGAQFVPRSPRSSKYDTEELRRLCHENDTDEKYDVAENVGRGASGVVYLAVDKESHEKVAIKEIDINKVQKKDMLLMEIKVMKELKHKNIINFVEAYFVEHTLSVVMEYLAGGQLTNILQAAEMNEEQIASVCQEVIEGIQYLLSLIHI